MKIGRLVIALSAYDNMKVAEKSLAKAKEEFAREEAKLDPDQRAAFEVHVSGERDLIAEMTQGSFARRDL